MKQILLLGDSIRMGYEKYVQEKLKEHNIVAPEENCKFSSYMLNSLRFWLPKVNEPAIIHYNAGLWDTACLYVDDGPFIKKEEYVRNMLSVTRELRRTGAKLIFATTTPVLVENISAVATPSIDKTDAATVFKQDNDRIIEYNNALVSELKKQGVMINDLHALVYDDKEKYICDDGIHMNEAGKKLLGDAVVDKIKEALK